MKEKISIIKKNHGQVLEGLSQILADTYILALKTQNFHWNVSGPHFYSYHLLFETQYKQLFDSIDVIAERIRALKAPAPGTFHEYLKMGTLSEAGHHLTADQMLRELAHDHEAMAKHLTGFFHVVEKDQDQVTLDLLVERKEAHDKAAWMLRSSYGRG